jgi:hypothetical protein
MTEAEGPARRRERRARELRIFSGGGGTNEIHFPVVRPLCAAVLRYNPRALGRHVPTPRRLASLTLASRERLSSDGRSQWR